jgi:glycosyltransferase involved in cell wall biosynthesis
MKICHIITGLNNGGCECTLYNLVVRDNKNTHIVISLIGSGHYSGLLLSHNIKVYPLNFRICLKSVFLFHRLAAILKSEKPDLVQTWMYHADLIGGIVSRLLSIPVVWGIHNTSLEIGKASPLTILIRLICVVLSYIVPSAIVCCAYSSQEVHTRLGYKKSIFHVIFNGYDLNYYKPDYYSKANLRRTLSLDSRLFLIGMVARFDPYKDHSNLLKSLVILVEKHVPFKVLLVGPGISPDNACLVKLFNQLGFSNHVLLLGTSDYIPGFMSLFDIHVLSSSAEAFPNVLSEAMACGTPCVSTDVGDARLIIGDTGWIVPPSDSHSLGTAMYTAFKQSRDIPSWSHRSRRCRSRVAELFSLQSMVFNYRTVWASHSL